MDPHTSWLGDHELVGTAKNTAPSDPLSLVAALRQPLGYVGGIVPAVITLYQPEPEQLRSTHPPDPNPPHVISLMLLCRASRDLVVEP